MLVDVHAHLDDKAFKGDLELVVRRAEEAGVKAIINNGIDPLSNRKTLDLARMFPVIKPALGIFPTYAVKMKENDFKKELFFISKSNPVAIRQVGLDLHHLNSTEKQAPLFQKFIRLSKDISVPIIVHTRKAENESIEILENEDAKNVILHCFSGSIELARRCEKNGWYFSIPPIIKTSKHFRELARNISITRLLTETDAPYLSPVRGQRNEPAFVRTAIKVIAEVKGLNESEVERNIFANFQRIFSS